MDRRFVVCLLFILSFSPGWRPKAQNVEPLWRKLAQGIDYREFFLPEPDHIYVTRLDRANPQAIIDTSLANGVLSAGLEPLSAQVERFDGALGYWDGSWGPRYQVAAAINGGFFDTESGSPSGGLIYSGWYAHRYSDRQTQGGFAWRFDRLALVSECLIQRPGKQLVILPDTGEFIAFDGVNIPREEDQLVLYTPQYGPTTPPTEEGIEILVELAQPLILTDEMQTGTVRDVQMDKGGLYLPFDHLALSASGIAAREMTGHFEVGDLVGFSFDLRHLEAGCRKERSESLIGASAGAAGGDVFLREGVIQRLNDLGSVLRNPRTAVAINDRFVFFIVVDGRDRLRSLGMSMVELALFAKLKLGATWGVAMDGGGSSTMVLNGKVVNHPNSETIVRLQSEDTPRGVANGLMMIALQPAEISQRYKPGDGVVIGGEGEANLRLGPGTNYPPMALLSVGRRGVVVDHAVNGVLAKGFSWWKIDFDGQVGWVSELVFQLEP